MSLPSEITQSYWIYHGSSNVERKDGDKYMIFHPPSNVELKDTGKWMLFYPKKLLDIKWQEICYLWNNHKLPGVIYMKCSTSLKNSRSNNDSDGVIILYCNNSDNEYEIMNIGKNIIPYIQDCPYKIIYYKTNLQTQIGTRATGITTNYLYKLNIETPIITSYSIPFFPDYVIDIPNSYTGGYDLSGIIIKNLKGRIIKPKLLSNGNMSWILKNPESSHPEYDILYNKNIIGSLSQTLYESDIRKIYNNLKSLNKNRV